MTMNMEMVINRLDEMFDEYVPCEGKADTVGGEILRAYARIRYRYLNDGDRIGIGYGRETCNAPARYLSNICVGEVRKCVEDCWGLYSDRLYEAAVDNLGIAVLAHLDRYSELFDMDNDVDMWDCAVAGEDEDNDWDDEEDW